MSDPYREGVKEGIVLGYRAALRDAIEALSHIHRDSLPRAYTEALYSMLRRTDEQANQSRQSPGSQGNKA